MSNAEKFDPYSFTVHTERVFIEGGQYFKTSVFELPDVEVYEETAAEAYEVIIQCIVDLHDAAVRDGRPFPYPETRDEYSGRVTLRMRKELHKRLDMQAKRNGTTLNAEIVCQLSDTSSVQEMVRQLAAEMRKTTTAAIMRYPVVVPQGTMQQFGTSDADQTNIAVRAVSTAESFNPLTRNLGSQYLGEPKNYWDACASASLVESPIPVEKEKILAH